MIADLTRKYGIKHKVTSPYHPQANEQVESTNKVLENILTNIVSSLRRDWVERLPKYLWAYKTTWRNTIGYSPYELVYKKISLFPVEFEVKTLRIALEVGLNSTATQKH